MDPAQTNLSVRRNPLARDTVWVGVSQAVSTAMQALYFVIAARTLGVSGFGQFAAALALVSVLGTFAALGTGNIMVMEVSRRPKEFARHWGNALLAIPSVAALLTLIALAIAVAIPAVDPAVVGVLCLSELIMNRAASTAGQAFQSLGRMRGASVVWAFVPLARGIGAVLFLLLGSRDVLTWAVIYTTATGIAAAVAVAAACVCLGRPVWGRWHGIANTKLGIYFSLSQAFSSIYADIDKTMLAQIASSSAAGIYTAAYRGISVVFLPTMALFQAAYGRFFQRGEHGIGGTKRFARTLFPYVVVTNIAAGIVLFLSSWLAPLVFGSGYEDTAPALRWLAAVPLLQSLTYLYGDVLTGAGEQGLRTFMQFGAAVLNVALNLVLDPIYSWRGAAWATLLTFAALAVALRLGVAAVSRRKPEGLPHPATG